MQNKLHRSALFITGSKVGNALLTFAGVAIFTQQLGTGQVGQFFLFQSMHALLVFISDGSIRTAVEKRISEGGPRPEIISTALSIKSIVLLVVCTVLWFSRSWVNDYIGVEIIVPLIFSVVIADFGNLFIRIIAGDLDIGATAVVELSRSVVWLVGGLVLLTYGFESTGLIYAYVVGTLVMTLWALKRCDLAIGTPSLSLAMSLWAYSKYDIIGGASSRINNWADVLIIGFFLSSSAVGVYEIAWRITKITGLMSVGISQTMFPDVSNAAAKNDMSRVRENIHTAILWSTIFVIPALFGGILLGDQILDIVFGVSAPEGAVVLSILLLGHSVFVNFTPCKRILDGLGGVHLSARGTAVMALVNVVLNIILTQSHGIVGAAVGTSVSMGVGLLIVGFYLRQQLKFTYPIRETATFLAASIAMTAAVGAASLVINTATLIGLAIAITVGMMIYVFALLAARNTRKFILQQYRSIVA